MRRSWLLCTTIAAACGAPAPRAPASAPPAVPILASAPCEVPASADAFYAAMKEHAHGHAHAGPPGPPPPPVEEIYPAADIDRLRTAAAEGRCRKIRYRSNGVAVAGFVLEPAATGPAPVIVVARGGNRDLGTIGAPMLVELTALAERGFVVVATQYRGADGGEGADELGGADLADLENLVPLARALPSADPRNVFLLGYSRGGMMAAMALRDRLPVRAAALFSGMFDLAAVAAARPEMERNFAELIPNYATARDAELRRRSAVQWADEITAPVLLLAGTRDTRVDVSANSQRLAQLLAARGAEHKLVTYDDDHMLAAHRAQTTREIADWFLAHRAPALP